MSNYAMGDFGGLFDDLTAAASKQYTALKPQITSGITKLATTELNKQITRLTAPKTTKSSSAPAAIAPAAPSYSQMPTGSFYEQNKMMFMIGGGALVLAVIAIGVKMVMNKKSKGA